MFKREQSAKTLFLPYKQFGIDIFKKDNNNSNNLTNSIFSKKMTRTPISSSYRPLSKAKSETLFDIEKKLKKMTLSNRSFFNYMNKYTKLTQNFTFKTPNISIYPKKKNPKYLPIYYLQKVGLDKNVEKEITNDDDKTNNNNEINFGDINDLNKFAPINFDDNLVNIKDENDNENNNENEDNVIKEKPYGFKYKDTRIVYDKSKMRIKSSLFRNNNSDFNLTNINPSKTYKNRTNFNFHISKEEKSRNRIFKYFYEGDFLETPNQRPPSKIPHNLGRNNKRKNMIINDNDVNNSIQILYDMIKNIKNINDFSTNKSMKYNIKNYYKKEDFSFQVDIESICLKYIIQDLNESENNINNVNEKINENNNSQKLYLPFSYLPIFYLLDYTSFKIFLSEIIYYNKKTNLMEINQNEVISIINKYKKFITLNVINQDPNKKRKMEKITYLCKELHFQNTYDWIIYLNDDNNNHNENEENKNNEGNENNENFEFIEQNEQNEQNDLEDQNLYNKNIIYKVKIKMPIIKFHIINRRMKIKKYLNKNLIIKLLKNDFAKWEENVLCELFMNKQFRNIMNSTLATNKQIFNFSLLTKKIFIDRTENKEDLLNKSKYEFFITNAQKDFSHFLYFSPYSILIVYGKEKDKKTFTNIHLNIRESINVNKYSKYWGYMNTLNKCIKIDQNTQKIYLDLKILEKDPKKFFYLKRNENNKDNNKENIKDFDKLGFIRYKNNEDIEMDLLNCSIVEIQITSVKMDKRYYKVPKTLLEIFLSENIKNENLNSHISDFSEFILFNDEILNLRREEIDLRRKAFQNDGTVKLDEDFSSEKHKTIFSFKNLNKLNSFRINPQNRYSNNPGMNKSIGSGINFFSGEGNFIKRSETNDKINLAGLGISYKSYEQLYKSQKVGRKFVKKYTVYHRKRESKLSKTNVKEYNNRSPHKNNTNILKIDDNDKDKEKTNNLSHEQ